MRWGPTRGRGRSRRRGWAAGRRRLRSRGRRRKPLSPRLLVLRARPGADHGLPRAPRFEEDRGRDREDAKAGRSLDVLVDVQFREADLALVLSFQLGEDRLDGVAGAAPGGPEVDDDRLVGLEHVTLEAVVGHLAHGYSLPVTAWRRI